MKKQFDDHQLMSGFGYQLFFCVTGAASGGGAGIIFKGEMYYDRYFKKQYPKRRVG